MIITIDGPAGSGKSAAALQLATRLGLPHLDTGAMYRAVALDALEQNLLDQPDAMGNRARLLALDFDWTKSPAEILLNGRHVESAIRTPQVTEITWHAADNPWVREELVKRQRHIGEACRTRAGGLVTEGRDQGTIVFPNAEFKFFLDAHPEERARRRIGQLAAKGIAADLDEVLQQILQRDQRDQGRSVGPLVRPANAIVLDTTDLTLAQVVQKMFEIIQQKQPAAPAAH